MQHNSLAQLEIPVVMGNHLEELPDDLFIPPNALEIFLETFSGPLDLLLYLIRKDDIDILDLDISNPNTLNFLPNSIANGRPT